MAVKGLSADRSRAVSHLVHPILLFGSFSTSIAVWDDTAFAFSDYYFNIDFVGLEVTCAMDDPEVEDVGGCARFSEVVFAISVISRLWGFYVSINSGTSSVVMSILSFVFYVVLSFISST